MFFSNSLRRMSSAYCTLRVRRCGPAPHTLTLFKTKIADFPTLFKTEFRFLIPCLRHLTQNHTLCKTIINIESLSYLIHYFGNHKTIYSLINRVTQAIYRPRKDTLFKSKIDEIDTLIKTKNDKIDTLFKRKIPKNIPWLAARPH